MTKKKTRKTLTENAPMNRAPSAPRAVGKRPAATAALALLGLAAAAPAGAETHPPAVGAEARAGDDRKVMAAASPGSLGGVTAEVGVERAGAVAAPADKAAAGATKLRRSAAEQAKIARGAHLAITSGCHDCHTPFKLGPKGAEPDMTRMLSGHPEALVMPPAPKLPAGPWMMTVAATNTAWAGPWGTSFTANLTPDKETGLGTWTARTFIDTIRNGRHLGRGRPLLPPMPAAMYAHMPDADLEALFAFLQSIPAIKNRVPQPVPPAPTVSSAKP